MFKMTNLEKANALKARFDQLAKRKAAIEDPKTVIVSVDGHNFDLNTANRERVLTVLRNSLAMQHAECAAQAIDIGLEFE